MTNADSAKSGEFFSKDGIFSLKPLTWFRPTAHITHAVVSNNIIFAATTANVLIKASISDRTDISEIEISHFTDDRVHNLFVDPRGCHIVISMQSGVNFYTTRYSKKMKQISKSKDLLFDSLFWNQYNESDSTTQEILIGANSGVLYEAVLSYQDDRLISFGVETLWNELITLDQSISGLAVIRYPPGSSMVPVGMPHICVVLVTTPSRLYQFTGRIQIADSLAARMLSATQSGVAREGSSQGLYAPLFSAYQREFSGSKFIEFPLSYGYSDLKLFQKSTEEVPSHFSWMTASGLYCGKLEFSRLLNVDFAPPTRQENPQSHSKSITGSTKLIRYPTMPGELISLPLGICVTAFHVIIAYTDRVKAINLLNERPVFSGQTIDHLGGQTGNICRDKATGLIWLFSNRGLCQLAAEKEDTKIWRIYLEKGDFERARQYCKDAAQLEKVNCREAEELFSTGDYIHSAELFAETSTPFEEIALRFSQTSVLAAKTTCSGPVIPGVALTEDYNEEVEDGDDEALLSTNGDQSSLFSETNFPPLSCTSNLQLMTPSLPLKAFLRAKLAKFTKSSDSSSRGQAAIVAVWLIELLLGEVGILEDRCSKPDAPAAQQEELTGVRKEFRELIVSEPLLNLLPTVKNLVYQLLSSHGNHEDFIFFAKTMGDHVQLIQHYVSLGAYADALSTLLVHPSAAHLHYEYATQFSSCEPKLLVDAWLKAGDRLSPSRLLPSILLLPSNEAIRYLEFAANQLHCSEQALHHRLITLYAVECCSTSNESKLLDYLERHTTPNLCKMFEGALDHLDLIPEGIDLVDLATGSCSNLNSLALSATAVEPPMSYDPGFALRTCMENKCLHATVFLLKSLGLYKQAVEEALSKNDVDLAKEIAKSDNLDIDVQRALWQCIARHVITDQSNLQEATTLMRESSLLRLEDVFSMFPDFVTIDQFKETICESLEAYNTQIEEMKIQMRTTVESTNEIREQINNLKYNFEIIPENARCNHCLYALALRTFYVFPCGHFFHTDCLLNLVRPHLSRQDSSKLAELYTATESDSSVIHTFRAQFDELVAKDCILCGRAAIDGIEKPYFTNQEAYEREMQMWA